jgi:hypothetical protein
MLFRTVQTTAPREVETDGQAEDDFVTHVAER